MNFHDHHTAPAARQQLVRDFDDDDLLDLQEAETAARDSFSRSGRGCYRFQSNED